MRSSTIKVLLDAGTDANKHYHLPTRSISPLHMAVLTGISTAYTELVGYGAIFDEETACRLRARANRYGSGNEQVKLLQAVSLDANKFAALHGPVQYCGASKDSQIMTKNLRGRLLTAAKFGQLSVVKNIVQDRLTDINALDTNTGRTSLHYAARAGHVEIVKKLLECGADCNIKGREGITPLHSSVKREGSQCLALLLQQGINVLARDLKGFSVWHTAAERNNVKALILLKAWFLDRNSLIGAVASETPPHNGECDLRSHAGMTPLHAAVGAGALEAIEFLVNNGFDVSAVTVDGSMMLHYLASSDHGTTECEIADILLEQGADPCTSRVDGKTSLCLDRK